MGVIRTNIMTLQHSDGTIVQQHLPCRMDPVNIPWNMEVNSLIPTDWFDVIILNRTQPVPKRSDCFIDESDGTLYSVFGEVHVYVNKICCRVARYSGVTP
jgi:hypothetical protein